MKNHIIHSEILSTKANTLHALRAMLQRSRIEEMYILKIGDFYAFIFAFTRQDLVVLSWIIPLIIFEKYAIMIKRKKKPPKANGGNACNSFLKQQPHTGCFHLKSKNTTRICFYSPTQRF